MLTRSLLAAVAVGVALALSACASSPKPIPRLQVQEQSYSADYDRVWNVLADVLSEKRLPIRAFEKESGLITTDSVSSGARYVYFAGEDGAPGPQMSRWAGRTQYFLNIRVRRKGNGTTVEVLPHVEYMQYQLASGVWVELGWAACDSHGDIEQGIYDALTTKLGR